LVLAVGAGIDDHQFNFQPGISAGERPSFVDGERDANLYFGQTSGAWYINQWPKGQQQQQQHQPPRHFRVLDEAKTPDAITAAWQVCDPPSSGDRISCNANFGWQPAPNVHVSCYVPPPLPECRSVLVAGAANISLQRFDVLPGIGAGERHTFGGWSGEHILYPPPNGTFFWVATFLYFCKTRGDWYISYQPRDGACAFFRVLAEAKMPGAITAEWELRPPRRQTQCNATAGWQPAPHFRTSCNLPVMHTWQDATEVAVDQFHADATDTQGCGVDLAPPCRTISWGTTRVKPGGTVFVHGGARGDIYLGECSAAGIVINASLAVVGIGGAVIDCLGESRLFTFDGLAVWNSSGPAQLTLEALEVRHASMTAVSSKSDLVVHNCAFVNCSTAIHLEAIIASLYITASSFESYGGSPQVDVRSQADSGRPLAIDVKIAFKGCNFSGSVFTSDKAMNFTHCNFAESVIFNRVAEMMSLEHCVFNGAFRYGIDENLWPYLPPLKIAHCNFYRAFGEQYDEQGLLSLEQCNFNSSVEVSPSSFSAVNCTFAPVAPLTFNPNNGKFCSDASFVGCNFGGGVNLGVGSAQGVTYSVTHCLFVSKGFHVNVDDYSGGIAMTFSHCNFSASSIAAVGSKMGGFQVQMDRCSLSDSAVVLQAGSYLSDESGIGTGADIAFTSCTFVQGSSVSFTMDPGNSYGFSGINIKATNSTFSNSSNPAISVLLLSSAWTTLDINTTLTNCNFTNAGIVVNLAGCRGQNRGNCATARIATTLSGCNFVTSGGATGGAVSIQHGTETDESSSTVFITNCSFYHAVGLTFGFHPSTTIVVSGSHFVGMGGHCMVLRFQHANGNVLISIDNSIFDQCESLVGDGAAVSVQGAITSPSWSVTNSRFVDNYAHSGSGGALAAQGQAVVRNCSFDRNRAALSGGAIHFTRASNISGVADVVEHSNFTNNIAQNGGAISFLFPEDAPSNLVFKGDPSASWISFTPECISQNGHQPLSRECNQSYKPTNYEDPCGACGRFPACDGCPAFRDPDDHFQRSHEKDYCTGARYNFTRPPVVPNANVPRQWNWTGTNNSFALRDTCFRGNVAELSGGALSVPGGGTGRIERVIFEDNSALRLFGGGTSVGGNARLFVIGSEWRRNTCTQRGCQIYSTSAGGIDFGGNSTVDLGCAAGSEADDCRAGMSTVEAGDVTWGGTSVMVCPAGYELVDSSAHQYNVTLDSWKLKPPFRNWHTGTIPMTNCPCYFSNRRMSDNGTGLGNIAAVPVTILVSTLQYSCRSCAEGQYSLATPARGSRTIDVSCAACPYGASCSGGSAIAAPGFWGVATTSAIALSFHRCPRGYCCAKAPCASITACATNRTGTLCGSCALGFSQTVGSTACRLSVECNDAAWFLPLAVLLALIYTLAILHSSTASDTVAGAGGLDWATWPLNAVRPVVYYYQIAVLLPVGKASVGTAVVALTGLFNMQVHVSGVNRGFACPFKGLTMLQAIQLHYAVPVTIGAMLLLSYTRATRSGGYGSVPRQAAIMHNVNSSTRWRRPRR
jgi:predicted outer membrane repeat protein